MGKRERVFVVILIIILLIILLSYYYYLLLLLFSPLSPFPPPLPQRQGLSGWGGGGLGCFQVRQVSHLVEQRGPGIQEGRSGSACGRVSGWVGVEWVGGCLLGVE